MQNKAKKFVIKDGILHYWMWIHNDSRKRKAVITTDHPDSPTVTFL